jgi:hypothetical protein
MLGGEMRSITADLVIGFVVIFTNLAFGEKIDLVHLKNGSIIRGTVVETIPDSLVKITTYDGSLFVFDWADIVKLERVETYNEKYQILNYGRQKSVAGWCFLSSWALTAISSVALSDEMFLTTIIPVVGPFITAADTGEKSTHNIREKNWLRLSGILQASFVAWYVFELYKEDHSEHLTEFYINPNPLCPSINATVGFDFNQVLTQLHLQ